MSMSVSKWTSCRCTSWSFLKSTTCCNQDQTVLKTRHNRMWNMETAFNSVLSGEATGVFLHIWLKKLSRTNLAWKQPVQKWKQPILLTILLWAIHCQWTNSFRQLLMFIFWNRIKINAILCSNLNSNCMTICSPSPCTSVPMNMHYVKQDPNP